MLQPIGPYSTVTTSKLPPQTHKTPYETKPLYEQRNSDGSTFISALTYAKAKETLLKDESVTPVGKAFDAFLFSPPVVKAGKAFESLVFSAPVAAVCRALNNIACYAFGICEETEIKNEIVEFNKNIEHIELDNLDEEGSEAIIERLTTLKRDEEFSPPAWIVVLMSTSYQNNMNDTQKFTPCDSVQRNIIFINANSTGFQRDKLNITLAFGPSCSARRACIDQYLGDYFLSNKTIVKVPDSITIDSDFWEYNVSSFYLTHSWRLTCQGEHKLLLTFLNELQNGLDNVANCNNDVYKKSLLGSLIGTVAVVTVFGVGCFLWKHKDECSSDELEYIGLQPLQLNDNQEYNVDQQSTPLMESQQTNYQSMHSKRPHNI